MHSESARHITLLVPGLLGFADRGELLPASAHSLTRVLARADRLTDQLSPGFEQRLFHLFSIVPAPDQDLPVAAITRLVDMGVVDREWWIRADPVYLEPRRDGLVLYPVELGREEAASLAAELVESLGADGWLLRVPGPQRWYLKPPMAPDLTTTPLAEVLGRDIRTFLPQGRDQRVWNTRLNEIQILLHTARANAAREARGERPANSVWFWGGGRLPDAATAGFGQVWSDEPLAQGLARLCGVAAASLPTDGVDGFCSVAASEQLLVFDALSRALRHGDAHAWGTSLQGFLDTWLVPLQGAVDAGTLDGLTLLAETGPQFRYRRGHRLRFWRRPRALSVYRAA